MTRRRAPLAAASAALLALLLAGCTAGQGSTSDSGGVAPQPDTGVEAPADGGVVSPTAPEGKRFAKTGVETARVAGILVR